MPQEIKKNSKKIYIIAGEESGDVLGAKLISAISSLEKDVSFSGIGGNGMKKEGIKSLFPMEELSIMGFWEIIPHIPKILKRIKQTVADILEKKPDIVITIDAPAFNVRVAKKIKKLNPKIKLVHYVAPTVWAYKEKRAEKFAKIYDHMLLLLPFEKPYFDKVGLNSTFVGHPITEDISSKTNVNVKDKYKISEDEKIVAFMLGSRKKEISRLSPIFESLAEKINQKYPKSNIFILSTKRFHEKISSNTKTWKSKINIVSDEEVKEAVIKESDLAIVKSGTGTLKFALQETPLIVIYKVSTFSAMLAKMLLKIKYANLINIIANKEIIPEFIQGRCNAKIIDNCAKDLLDNKGIQQIKEASKYTKELYRKEIPSVVAAKTILQLFK